MTEDKKTGTDAHRITLKLDDVFYYKDFSCDRIADAVFDLKPLPVESYSKARLKAMSSPADSTSRTRRIPCQSSFSKQP